MKKILLSYQSLTMVVAFCALLAFNASQPRTQSVAQADFDVWLTPIVQSTLAGTPVSGSPITVTLYLPSYGPSHPNAVLTVSTTSLAHSKIVRLLELLSESQIISHHSAQMSGAQPATNGEYIVTISEQNRYYFANFDSDALNENITLRNFLLLIKEYASEK